MSDTPRTDEAEANAIASGIPISMVCRQLERELNEAKNEVNGFCRLLDEDNVILAIVRLERIIKERDEARECLREILGGFGVCGCHVPSLYATGIRSQIEIDRWRKAAGLTNSETEENAPVINLGEKQ